jgi:hypothetical protein
MSTKKVYTMRPEDGTRNTRADNIAAALLHLAGLEVISISKTKLRIMQRSTLGMRALDHPSEPDVEEWRGDLRAHGDAMGKKGLGLRFIKRNGEQIIPLDEGNLELCETWLRRHELVESEPELKLDMDVDLGVDGGELPPPDDVPSFQVRKKGQGKSIWLIHQEPQSLLVQHLCAALRKRPQGLQMYVDELLLMDDRIRTSSDDVKSSFGPTRMQGVRAVARVNRKAVYLAELASYCYASRRILRLEDGKFDGKGDFERFVLGYIAHLTSIKGNPDSLGEDDNGWAVRNAGIAIIDSYIERAKNELAEYRAWSGRRSSAWIASLGG